MEKLLDPQSIPQGQGELEITMCPQAADIPVLQTRDGKAWTPDTARHTLQVVSNAAGLNFALLPHAIRRSAAVSYSLDGKQLAKLIV